MKRALLIVVAVLVSAIVAVFVLGFPGRFRLQSVSPSGNSHVVGLRFQGRNTHELDGTLRLFVVSHDQIESKQQTSIPWGRDLAIKWRESKQGEIFVVEKKGRAVIEFQIDSSQLTCTKGAENLADDPYKPAEQGVPPNDR